MEDIGKLFYKKEYKAFPFLHIITKAVKTNTNKVNIYKHKA